ncbi:hypothetical protein QM543_09900 [Pantoea eucrina]|uniref:hypothetical protein n=1 Tax=Pantoea eucrina TaxID=472693 RepID=UPI0024B74851|nr:hypothetical protein [Pantoea eucrina]MDJ0023596.1 hypothetical protein [Pantoea eucrina]
MPKFSDVEFEQSYKHFLQVQREWFGLITPLIVYSEENANGEDARPIAFTNDKKILDRAQHLITEWQRFADLADAKRAETQAKTLAVHISGYSPVPTIMVNPRKVTVTRFPGTSSGKATRESILNRYHQQLRKLDKVPFAAGAILSLKEEMKAFENAPEGALYRLRMSNYFDTQVMARFDSPNDERNVDNYRYGAHGMLIYSEHMDLKTDFTANLNPSSGAVSVFDLIKPLPCAVLPSATVYLMDDVDAAKLHHKQIYVIETAIYQRERLFKKRSEALMLRSDTQEQAQKAQEKIKAGAEAVAELNAMDRELMNMKTAAGDTELLTVPEMRARYANEFGRRSGHTLQQLVERAQKLRKV